MSTNPEVIFELRALFKILARLAETLEQRIAVLENALAAVGSIREENTQTSA